MSPTHNENIYIYMGFNNKMKKKMNCHYLLSKLHFSSVKFFEFVDFVILLLFFPQQPSLNLSTDMSLTLFPVGPVMVVPSRLHRLLIGLVYRHWTWVTTCMDRSYQELLVSNNKLTGQFPCRYVTLNLSGCLICRSVTLLAQFLHA